MSNSGWLAYIQHSSLYHVWKNAVSLWCEYSFESSPSVQRMHLKLEITVITRWSTSRMINYMPRNDTYTIHQEPCMPSSGDGQPWIGNVVTRLHLVTRLGLTNITLLVDHAPRFAPLRRTDYWGRCHQTSSCNKAGIDQYYPVGLTTPLDLQSSDIWTKGYCTFAINNETLCKLGLTKWVGAVVTSIHLVTRLFVN